MPFSFMLKAVWLLAISNFLSTRGLDSSFDCAQDDGEDGVG
jgi:hypothetical protein